VLQAEGQYLPLLLRMEKAPAPLASVVIDRLLMVVDVDEDGTEHYHARFLLTKLHASSLDVQLPMALANMDARFLVDGKAPHWMPLESSGRVARLAIDPSLYDKPVVLAVEYQLTPGHPRPEGFCQTTLDPPVLVGNVFLGRVRWQVTLPQSMLAIGARGDASTEHSLQWRGWLPSLEPSISTTDLEQWPLTADLAAQATQASLLCGNGSMEPLQFFRIQRSLWFLLCSGVVLALGLVLWLLPASPTGWASATIAVLVGLVAMGLVWPALIPAILYGAAPGIVVLLVMLLGHWLLHERYRRRLVFMPGFTRIKGGSSLLRVNSTSRALEPSTIDAPLPMEGSNQ
jgi:hypothetical protein